ncbi:MAG: phage terminase large subunit family protein [Phycisphaeraceae bacterium]|nr:phage terminase large subunit family protein [Phycisphaeraceae bacterium]MCB9848784.1 phage terminase large subunit family protein [Phycisphaeraceae bacterium]
MPIDPRQLRPGELCRLLNSTPLGEVISERQLYRHRTRAGMRVCADGDPSRLDLFRYTAWLAATRHERLRLEAEQAEEHGGYEAYRDRKAREARALSLSGRDIGELPEVADLERRRACSRDFRAFCERYFPLTFHMDWSDDHLKVIAKIERAVLEGGLFAMAMPRGSGKTSLCETACLWALLYGHREFVTLVGADEAHAEQMLDAIKAELENSDDLLGDFPEVCAPIRALEGIHQRAAGQLHLGKQTHIGWTAREIVLPSIDGSAGSGSLIRVAGITGRIRGMKHKRPDGSSVRPSLVLIDDPQTDESARSPSQCANRERVLAGAILGLAGPGQKIAGLMTVTVVRPDDLADRLLDRDKHPAWQGERTKMVYAFPENERLWDEYARLRADGLRNERGITEATEFYRKHRVAMDAGSVIAWESRFNHDELSAIQHAMNLRLQNEAAFFAEYQNEPLPEDEPDDELLSADQIAAKANGHQRGEVPIGATRLTMFIDVQGKALFWLVAAWEDDYTGYVVDYGVEPDQKQPPGAHFTLRDIRRTLAHAAPRAGQEGAIYAGLERLAESHLAREWRRDDGAMVRIDRCLIDANWGASTDVVYQFCRQSGHASALMPSHGRYVGASSVPFSDYKRKRGERLGLNWRVPVVTGKRAVRHVVFDTNYWKSFVHARLAVPMGDPGCLSLFGRKPEWHQLLAEHLTSEYRIKTEGRGRTVDEWKIRVDGLDNHWLDCLVGAAVAASMEGAVLFGTDANAVHRPRVRLSELQRQKIKA